MAYIFWYHKKVTILSKFYVETNKDNKYFIVLIKIMIRRAWNNLEKLLKPINDFGNFEANLYKQLL
ncbi:hypothetical protein BpHYR1_022556 [Brachionus plicatilis]|uniref:Uncharacterized protein n=1 Tax=Brachionus plicatilis TaxID=10195 RepID=A0A3M7PXN2_BRAPC|nr:hypothetical protein BpHYR1_022556 [Brachionus plicatilis]